MKWCLIGKIAEGEPAQTVPIASERFTIGRRDTVSLRVPCPSVSKLHAELVQRENGLWVHDLGSTNGTFVNGRQVEGEAELRDGDLLQIATVAFRVTWEQATTNTVTKCVDACDEALLLTQMERLLSEHNVCPKYQPIIELNSRKTLAYEVLGRSKLFGLTTPKIMFEVAARLDQEPQLSHLMRLEGVKQSQEAGAPHLFVNTHPREVNQTFLAPSLKQLREVAPQQTITIEIHEAACTDPALMLEIRALLRDLDMSLAYDDFGVGQTRFQELAAVPPDYVKFDMSMIRDLDRAAAGRQNMVRSLVDMVRSLNIRTLAEGVETEGEHRVCQELGFELGQGFLYGKPAELPSPRS
jgi:EAL domain-containing protein (putative c-di-GMP-specific phosphodiesterase class I)